MSTLDNPNAPVNPSSIGPTILRYGLIGALVFIVYALIGNLTGMTSPGAGFGMMALNLLISLVLFVGVIVIAVRNFRDSENNGFISFKNAFLIGLGVVVIIGILNGLFTYLYATVIEPDYLETVLGETERMYERFNMSEDQIEELMAQMRDTMTPGRLLIQSLIGSVIMGAIVSAIVGAIMKRNPENA